MPAGEVIKPDTFKVIKDEGMPLHGRPYQKGNLYVQFKVEFPESLDVDAFAALRKVLPVGPPAAADTSDMDLDDVHDVPPLSTVPDIEQELKSRAHLGKGTGSEAYDSEDEEDGMPRGQRVQCAQS